MFTFASMNNVKVKGDCIKTIKTDRDLFRRLFVAADGDRDVHLKYVFEHELSPVSLSIANTDTSLRSEKKGDLGTITESWVELIGTLAHSDVKPCTIIDGMALVQAMGSPMAAHTFGAYADAFSDNVKCHFT